MRQRGRGNGAASYNRRVSVVLLIIGLVFVFDLLWWHTADRLLRPVTRSNTWRVALAVFMGAQVLCLMWVVAGRWILRNADAPIPTWLLILTFVWHLLVLPATTLGWLGFSAGRGIAALARAVAPHPRSTAGPAAEAPPSRRQFLGAAVAAAPPLVTVIGASAATAQLDEFRVRPISLPIPGLPKDLDGLTIAQVSDIHVGRFTSGSTLARIVAATNDLRSDLVLLTGDLINMNLSDLPASLDAVRRMEGRHGVYMVEGNHDLIEDRREFRRVARASGIPLLVNETATARVRGVDVQLLGLRWGSGVAGAGRSADRRDAAIAASLAELLPSMRPVSDAFPILLAHHPHALDHAAAAGISLTLSGHTHGGQLMLTPNVGFGPWMYRYWSGAYRKGDAWGVISNGVGNWFPLRVCAPAEIIHLTLRRA